MMGGLSSYSVGWWKSSSYTPPGDRTRGGQGETFRNFTFLFEKLPPPTKKRLGRHFLQYRLKRIVLNFQPDPGHPQGVTVLSKFHVFSESCPRLGSDFDFPKVIFSKNWINGTSKFEISAQIHCMPTFFQLIRTFFLFFLKVDFVFSLKMST